MKKEKYKIVIDTNVFISSLKSKNGASFKLLYRVSREKFEQNISPTLIFEYESVAKRQSQGIPLDASEIDEIIDMLCRQSKKCEIFFLWRPVLKDPKDDFVLELALDGSFFSTNRDKRTEMQRIVKNPGRLPRLSNKPCRMNHGDNKPR